MTYRPSARLAARSACALFTLAIVSREASAQGNPQYIYNEFSFNYAGAGPNSCGGSYIFNQYSGSASCTRVGATATTFASSLNGELRARATLTGTGARTATNSYLQSASASTFASFAETFTFVGSVPASVVFHYALTGSPSFTRPSGSRTSYLTRAVLTSTVSITNGVGGSIIMQDDRRSGTPGFAQDPPSVTTTPTGSITAQLRGNPVVHVNNGFQVFATLISYFGEPATGTADADFSHTGRIAFIQAFDESGADISESVTVTTASGVNYAFGAAPSAVVPEPGTWALLGTGLIGLGVVARRRRSA